MDLVLGNTIFLEVMIKLNKRMKKNVNQYLTIFLMVKSTLRTTWIGLDNQYYLEDLWIKFLVQATMRKESLLNLKLTSQPKSEIASLVNSPRPPSPME